LLETTSKRGKQKPPSIARLPIWRLVAVHPLSEQHTLILQLCADGLTYIQIGNKLLLAEGTIKGHFQYIFRRLQVNTQAQAIAWGFRNGIID